MSEPFIGEIRAMAFGFNPAGWLTCAGQIVSIQQFTTLYALLGTNFGGNGTTNFGLPNFIGFVPVGVGQALGDSFNPVLGETGGSASVTLTQTTMPNHTHTLSGATGAAAHRVNAASGNWITAEDATGTSIESAYAYAPNLNSGAVQFAATTISPYGQNLPHENRQPFQVLQFCIAYQGIYPQRP